jgi:hypothetical protein
MLIPAKTSNKFIWAAVRLDRFRIRFLLDKIEILMQTVKTKEEKFLTILLMKTHKHWLVLSDNVLQIPGNEYAIQRSQPYLIHQFRKFPHKVSPCA